MPKNRQVSYNYGDISVREFADAKTSNPNFRIRKKIGHALKSETNKLDTFEDMEDNLSHCNKKLTKMKNFADKSIEDSHVYNEFPNDIWFLISEHVRPEDVIRFALICKQTYAITTTMKFWRNLYRRYHSAAIELPVRLQLDCMARPGGIRACAIRSLFFTYPLFVDRLQSQSHQDFHILIKRHLVQVWYQQINAGKFYYFFKLKRKLIPGTRTFESEQLQRIDNKNAIKALRDVYSNTEEGCCLLVIESTTFHPLPRLDIIESNVVLASINNHLSRSCSHYRLEMNLANVSGQKMASVIYEPATSIKVYDWWVPTYSKYVKQGFQPKLEYLQDEKESGNDFNGTDDDAWDFVINNI